MRVLSGFEDWTISDGTYPPLRRADRLRLAFQMHAQPAALRPTEREEALAHRKMETYSFVGSVLWLDCSANTDAHDAKRTYTKTVYALEARGLRFYMEQEGGPRFKVGDRIEGVAGLYPDYYAWEEWYRKIPNAPALFHACRVERILLFGVLTSDVKEWNLLKYPDMEKAMAIMDAAFEKAYDTGAYVEVEDMAAPVEAQMAPPGKYGNDYFLLDFEVDEAPGWEPLYTPERRP